MQNDSGAQEAKTTWQELTQPIVLALPAKQRAFHVTHSQWSRVKKCVRSIKPQPESYWLVGCATSIGAFMSFLAGAIGLNLAEGVNNTVLIVFYSICASFGALAAVCFLGFLQTKGARATDIETTIEMMVEMETGFTDISGG